MGEQGNGIRNGARFVAYGLAGIGLTLLAFSWSVPFASNEAGCLDHCADAHEYFVWHPLHNIGAPFLAGGIGTAVAVWFTEGTLRWLLLMAATVSGWFGVFLFYCCAREVIGEMYLYGGPSLEGSDTSWLAFAGWTSFWLAAFLAPITARHDPSPWARYGEAA